MTTSGTSSVNFEIRELIEEAYERAGTELRTGYDLRSARRSLDIMMMEWANRGLNLWTVEEGTVPIVAGTASYAMPADTVDMIEHVIRDGTGESQTDTNLTRIGVSNYATMTVKNTLGRPSQIYVQRTPTPSFTLWPVPDMNYTLVTWRLRRIQDSGGAGYTMDLPFRFVPALVAGLAFYTAQKKPNLAERVAPLKQLYEEQFQLAYDEDRDRASLFLAPDVG